MKYAPAVKYSNGEIDKAGQLLINFPPGTKEYEQGLNKVNSWRASHQYPMNTFASTLYVRTKHFKGTLIAQRLKRLPTIVLKIQRFPEMQLSRMQDIGGVRAILKNIEQVRSIEEKYLTEGSLTHILTNHKDYISNPKDDGYRGVHLVYKYNNTLARNGIAQDYNGLLVEVQLRTELQHSWATAVEAMGTFMGDSFKNGEGSSDWREFFALASSIFASVEQCPPCPKHAQFPSAELYMKIARVNTKIGALDHLGILTNAAQVIETHVKKNKMRQLHYSIISLDMDTHMVEIYAFKKHAFDKANKTLAQLEQRDKARYDQVLVSVSSILSLKKAYPNYFLDIKDFVKKIEFVIKQAEEYGL